MIIEFEKITWDIEIQYFFNYKSEMYEYPKKALYTFFQIFHETRKWN
jgi:hypothetical protein